MPNEANRRNDDATKLHGQENIKRAGERARNARAKEHKTRAASTCSITCTDKPKNRSNGTTPSSPAAKSGAENWRKTDELNAAFCGQVERLVLAKLDRLPCDSCARKYWRESRSAETPKPKSRTRETALATQKPKRRTRTKTLATQKPKSRARAETPKPQKPKRHAKARTLKPQKRRREASAETKNVSAATPPKPSTTPRASAERQAHPPFAATKHDNYQKTNRRQTVGCSALFACGWGLSGQVKLCFDGLRYFLHVVSRQFADLIFEA